MDKKKPRILVTYVEAGMGHIVSAASIEASLRDKYGDEFEIIPSYTMTEDPDKINLVRYNKYMIRQVGNTNKFPIFGHFIFKALWLIGASTSMRFIHRRMFMRKATRQALETIKKHDPDVIVSTHFYPGFLAIDYKKRFNPNCEAITYNPDNNVHCWWDNRRDGWFLVNGDYAEKNARRRFFKRDRVVRVPLSVRREVSESNLTKREYRKKHNLPPDNFTVLVADGVYAMGRSKKFVDKLVRIQKPITILVIAGKNEKAYKFYSKLAGQVDPNVTLIPFRYIEEIYELYGAADLFITKAGPNSLLECACMGTPIVTNLCPQPMETAANKLYIKHLKCGVFMRNPWKTKRFVESCIDDPTLLDRFKPGLAKVDKNANGAEVIADFIAQKARRQRDGG